ncbi:MAG: hypothetical protein VR75_17620 [Hyphomonadaceae bacterium BRH_c29]|nr:MAG: hypothetical protein VR75_17620 [Hyphomonadaceae bacterium BRH_c29]
MSCPRCGALANIQDGEYEYQNGVLVALRALDDPTLRSLEQILEQFKSEDKTASETVEAIRAVAPEVGAILDKVGDGKYALAALMFFVLLLLARCSSGGSLITINYTEINALWDQSVEMAKSAELDDTEQDDEEAAGDDPAEQSGPEAPPVHSNVAPTDPENVQNKPPRSER